MIEPVVYLHMLIRYTCDWETACKTNIFYQFPYLYNQGQFSILLKCHITTIYISNSHSPVSLFFHTNERKLGWVRKWEAGLYNGKEREFYDLTIKSRALDRRKHSRQTRLSSTKHPFNYYSSPFPFVFLRVLSFPPSAPSLQLLLSLFWVWMEWWLWGCLSVCGRVSE